MALKQGHEIATIDVELVTLTTSDGIELGLKTSNQITVDPQIETTEAIKLIIKGVLVAQKRESSTLTGNTLTLTDNVFNPELMKLLQGGTITYTPEGAFQKYTPPVSGQASNAVPFTLNVYTAHYDASGLVVDYEKMKYPNCTGNPVSISAQDNTFNVPSYSIISAPAEGEAPYEMEMVKTLPVVSGVMGTADWETE